MINDTDKEISDLGDSVVRDSKTFNAEADRQPNSNISQAEAVFHKEVQEDTGSETYHVHGAARLASWLASKATRCKASRRIFLIGGAATLVGGILSDKFREKIADRLWETLEIEKYLPFLAERDEDSPVLPADFKPLTDTEWLHIESNIEAAMRKRDFAFASRIEAAIENKIARLFVRAVFQQIRGEVGEALATFDVLEQADHAGCPLFSTLPPRSQLYFMRIAARVNSIACDPKRSLEYYGLIRQKGLDNLLSEVQRVALWRDELNHLIQTADSVTAYYDGDAPVLRRYDALLKKCLQITGSDLESALKFHELIGPAVICMKEYRQWIRYSRTDIRLATAALTTQRRAIEAMCKTDLRLGPMRFTPLANQHARAGDWKTAKDTLAQQAEMWASFDDNPARNNRVEYGVHKIMSGIVHGIGLRDPDTGRSELHAARSILAGTGSSVFLSDIHNILVQMPDLNELSVDQRGALALNRRLSGTIVSGSASYRFGLD